MIRIPIKQTSNFHTLLCVSKAQTKTWKQMDSAAFCLEPEVKQKTNCVGVLQGGWVTMIVINIVITTPFFNDRKSMGNWTQIYLWEVGFFTLLITGDSGPTLVLDACNLRSSFEVVRSNAM